MLLSLFGCSKKVVLCHGHHVKAVSKRIDSIPSFQFSRTGISQDFFGWDFDRVVENEKPSKKNKVKRRAPRECLIIFQIFFRQT